MKWKLPLFWTVSILLAGCNLVSSANGDENFKDTGQTVESDVGNGSPAVDTVTEPSDMSNEEIIKETGKQITTDIPVILPKTLPVPDKVHLTSVTNSQQNQYTVMFFGTEQPVTINSEELKNPQANVATIKATEYSSPEEAAKQINHMDHSVNGAQAVDLGYGIKGYRDAGAGSQFLGWNEGRWSLALKAHTDQGDEIVEEAKKAVQLLEEETLPIPHEYGSVKLDVSDSKNRSQHIAWQDGKIVYEVETPGSFLDVLKIAVSMHE